MKPGDMIEWVYVWDNFVVNEGKKLWSSTMKKWVPIGGTALLISITDETKCARTYTWLSEKGLFHARVHARVDDTHPLGPAAVITAVVPRARG